MMQKQPDWLDGVMRKIVRLEQLDKAGLIRVGEDGGPVWAEDGSPVTYLGD